MSKKIKLRKKEEYREELTELIKNEEYELLIKRYNINLYKIFSNIIIFEISNDIIINNLIKYIKYKILYNNSTKLYPCILSILYNMDIIKYFNNIYPIINIIYNNLCINNKMIKKLYQKNIIREKNELIEIICNLSEKACFIDCLFINILTCNRNDNDKELNKNIIKMYINYYKCNYNNMYNHKYLYYNFSMNGILNYIDEFINHKQLSIGEYIFLNDISSEIKSDDNNFDNICDKFVKVILNDLKLCKYKNVLLNLLISLINKSNKINNIDLIFNVVSTRKYGLDFNEFRNIFYEYLCKINLNDSIDISCIFKKYYKMIFNNECSDICYCSLINVLKYYTNYLEYNIVLDLLNNILYELINSKKNEILKLYFIRYLSFISNNNIIINFINNNKLIFNYISNLFNPPYNIINSTCALYICEIVLRNSELNKLYKKLYTIDNINNILHERNLINYSKYYCECICKLINVSYIDSNLNKHIIERAITVIFHCSNVDIRDNIENIVKREKYSCDELEVILINLNDNILKYGNEYIIGGNKKIFPSWTSVNINRIYNIILILIKKFSSDKEMISIIMKSILINISILKNTKMILNILKKFSRIIDGFRNEMINYVIEYEKYLVECNLNEEYSKYLIECIVKLCGEKYKEVIKKVVESLINNDELLSVCENDINIYESKSKLFYNIELVEEYNKFIDNIDRNYKLNHKKYGMITKEYVRNIDNIDILSNLINDKIFIDSCKMSMKLITKIKEVIVNENISKVKVEKYKKISYITFVILKCIVKEYNIVKLYPYLCTKLYILINSVLLNEYVIDILVIMGEKLIINDKLLGRMVSIINIRNNGNMYKLAKEVLELKVELQILNIVNILKSYKFTNLSSVIAILSLSFPVIYNELTYNDNTKNIFELLYNLYNFKSTYKDIKKLDKYTCNIILNTINYIIVKDHVKEYGIIEYIVENCSVIMNINLCNNIMDICIKLCYNNYLCVLALKCIKILYIYIELIDNIVSLSCILLILSYHSNKEVNELSSEITNLYTIKYGRNLVLKLIENIVSTDKNMVSGVINVVVDTLCIYPEFINDTISELVRLYGELSSNNERINVLKLVHNVIDVVDSSGIDEIKSVIKFMLSVYKENETKNIEKHIILISNKICNVYGEKYGADIYSIIEGELKKKTIKNNNVIIISIELLKYIKNNEYMISNIRSELLNLLNNKKYIQKLISNNINLLVDVSNMEVIDKIISNIANYDSISYKIRRGYCIIISSLIYYYKHEFVEKYSILSLISRLLNRGSSSNKEIYCGLCLVKCVYENYNNIIMEMYGEKYILFILQCYNITQFNVNQYSIKTCIKILRNMSSIVRVSILNNLLYNYIDGACDEIKLNICYIISVLCNDSNGEMYDVYLPKVMNVCMSSGSKTMREKCIRSMFKLAVGEDKNLVEWKNKVINYMLNKGEKEEILVVLLNDINMHKWNDVVSIKVVLLIMYLIFGIFECKSIISNVKLDALNICYNIDKFVPMPHLKLICDDISHKLLVLLIDDIPTIRLYSSVTLKNILKYCTNEHIKILYSILYRQVSSDSTIIKNGSCNGIAIILNYMSYTDFNEYLSNILHSTSYYDNINIYTSYIYIVSEISTIVKDKYNNENIDHILKWLISNMCDNNHKQVLSYTLNAIKNYVYIYQKDIIVYLLPYLKNDIFNVSHYIRHNYIQIIHHIITIILNHSTTSCCELDYSIQIVYDQLLDISHGIIILIYLFKFDDDINIQNECIKLWKYLTKYIKSSIIIRDILPNLIDFCLISYHYNTFSLYVINQCISELSTKVSDNIKLSLLSLLIDKLSQYIHNYQLSINTSRMLVLVIERIDVEKKEVKAIEKLVEVMREMVYKEEEIVKYMGEMINIINKKYKNMVDMKELYNYIVENKEELRGNIKILISIVVKNEYIFNILLNANEFEVIISSRNINENIYNIINIIINVEYEVFVKNKKYYKIILKSCKSNNIDIILNKLLDSNVNTCNIYNVIYIIIICLKVSGSVNLLKIHSFCMSLYNSEHSIVYENVVKIYEIVLSKDVSVKYYKSNIEIYMKEYYYNYKEVEYLRIFDEEYSVNILPICNLFKHTFYYLDESVLYNSIKLYENIISKSTRFYVPIYMYVIIGSLLRVINRRVVNFEIKLLALEVILKLLNYSMERSKIILQKISPQFIRILVNFIISIPYSNPDILNLYNILLQLQDISFDISLIIKDIMQINYTNNEQILNILQFLHFLFLNFKPLYMSYNIYNQLHAFLIKFIFSSSLLAVISNRILSYLSTKLSYLLYICHIKHLVRLYLSKNSIYYLVTLSYVIHSNFNRILPYNLLLDLKSLIQKLFTSYKIKLRLVSLYLSCHVLVNVYLHYHFIDTGLCDILEICIKSEYTYNSLLYGVLNFYSFCLVRYKRLFIRLFLRHCDFILYYIFYHNNPVVKSLCIYVLQYFLQCCRSDRLSLLKFEYLFKYTFVTIPLLIRTTYYPFESSLVTSIV